MNTLKGTIDVRMTLDEINKVNELIMRDTAKAIKTDEHYNLDYCPNCNRVLLKGDTFCSRCGQRLDTETKA